jgi:hypothetical protein
MAEDKKPVRVTYTKELESILKELEDANNYVAFELLCDFSYCESTASNEFVAMLVKLN